MALAQDLLTLAALALFCLSFACCGNRILRLLSVEVETDGFHFLVSVALGIIATETMLLLVQFSQQIWLGSYCVVVMLALFVLIDGKKVIDQIVRVLRQESRSRIERWLLWLIVFVLGVEFLIASAPLTGSDAQHYHFTVQKLIYEQGFHPLFSISHSFLCGQHHSLILFGLALGSEKLALGFIFLGGVLSAAVVAALSSLWASTRLALGLALLFLLTPVVFWQLSTSGSPDIYMAFFTGSVLLFLNRSSSQSLWRMAFIAGLLTGGVAGAKYSGCFIAAAIVISFVYEFRSLSATTTLFFSSVIGGISPYLRNAIWTGNPVFPFLAERLSPHLVSAYALSSLARDTGAAQEHNVLGLLPYILFASARAANVGLWDFFGPTILALFPFILLAFKNIRAWRSALVVWLISAASIYFSSGLTRFLLPLFPVALACVAAGVEWTTQKQWKVARIASVGVVGAMSLAGLGGLAFYGEKPIEAAVGLVPRETYLDQSSPQYEVVEAINRALLAPADRGKSLVFLRHLYYLRVPYVNGDPGNSFEIDPNRLNSADSWKEFLKAKQIAYVVRGDQYPPAVASALLQLEKQGDLIPIAEMEVKDLKGMRIDKVTATIPVVILKVND